MVGYSSAAGLKVLQEVIHCDPQHLKSVALSTEGNIQENLNTVNDNSKKSLARPGRPRSQSEPNAGFAYRLRELFGDRNYSELSVVFGVSSEAVAQYFKGKVLPKANVIEKIINETKCSADWLLTGRGQPYATPLPTVREQPETYTTQAPMILTLQIDEQNPIELKVEPGQSISLVIKKSVDEPAKKS